MPVRYAREAFLPILLILAVVALVPGIIRADNAEPTSAESNVQFTFAVTADMRGYSGPGQYDTPQYFRGACEAIAALGGVASWSVPATLILRLV